MTNEEFIQAGEPIIAALDEVYGTMFRLCGKHPFIDAINKDVPGAGNIYAYFVNSLFVSMCTEVMQNRFERMNEETKSLRFKKN